MTPNIEIMAYKKYLNSQPVEVIEGGYQRSEKREERPSIKQVYIYSRMCERRAKKWQASKRRNIKQKQMAVLLSTSQNPQTPKPNPQPSSQCSGTICDIINEVESTHNRSLITRV